MDAKRNRLLPITLAAFVGVITLALMMVAAPPVVNAQETPDPTNIPHVVAVDVGGQWVLVDFSITAGEFFIGSALTVLVLFSAVLMILFAYRKRYQ